MRRAAFLFLLLTGFSGFLYFESSADQAPFEIPLDYKPDIANGAYMTAAAGCVSCHEKAAGDTPVLEGGAPIASPFGDIGPPNISPHPEAGIGAWSQNDFLNAVKRGVSPDKQHYYPAFPYSHYQGLTDADVLDIHAYLMTLPPSDEVNAPTALSFPFNIRRGVGLWKKTDSFLASVSAQDTEYERGKYLVENAAHCGACHTPRNIILGADRTRAFDGAPLFDNSYAPPLSPERLRKAGEDAFVEGVLRFGLDLSGRPFQDPKMIAVAGNTRQLSAEDRKAIYDYLTSLN